ncbi:MAG: RagB/SusD family nutrient uptake outer membrane protein [Prevotellaceae bacterium]|nr:RagB/SusD family nutrient uptake outer membrane protein [Prevotellaceae bacterium]
MKSAIKYIITTLFGAAVFACNYLDVVPDNITTIDHAFADRYATEKYLASCYWAMPKSAGWNENPGIFGALEMCFNKEGQASGGMQFGLGYDNPASPRINYWGGKGDYIRSLYAGIRECNTLMENVVNVPDLSSYLRKRMFDEAKLLKAYMHFYLLSYYGPICPLRENTPVNESTRGVRVYREKVDDCFRYILQLLDEVIENNALPVDIQNRTTELGRFTMPVAYFLRAKVLVYWASPLFNGNTDYNGFIDHNGEHFFNQTYDPTRWTKAAEACEKAIEICRQAGIRLYGKSDVITSKTLPDSIMTVQTLRSCISDRWNVELIWGNSSYSVNSGLQSPCMPRLEQGTSSSTSSTLSMTLAHVDLFYSKNGIPIEEDPNYDYSNRFNMRTGDAAHRYYIKEGEQTAAMNFEREPRFYSTLGFDRGLWYGNHYSNLPDDPSQCLYPKARFGEFSSVFNPGDYNATGYFIKKLVSVNTTFRDANSVTYETYPFPDMRFADLLLFMAEALNETAADENSAPPAETYTYIDMIRTRAGLKGVVESWINSVNPSKPATKSGMREIIRRERKIELACEGHYYWDARRWKTAQREQTRLIQGWNVNASDVGEYYSVKTLYSRTFAHRDYFAPIPDDDMIKNPQLIQNPGW